MKIITEFEGVEDLHYFLMNVLNFLKGYYYCFCETLQQSVPFAGYQ